MFLQRFFPSCLPLAGLFLPALTSVAGSTLFVEGKFLVKRGGKMGKDATSESSWSGEEEGEEERDDDMGLVWAPDGQALEEWAPEGYAAALPREGSDAPRSDSRSRSPREEAIEEGEAAAPEPPSFEQKRQQAADRVNVMDLAARDGLFRQILEVLQGPRFKTTFGGVRNFRHEPRIERKIKAHEFAGTYTDYEFIYLTVLGFQKLDIVKERVVEMNNGERFGFLDREHTKPRNPAIPFLEQQVGMTMHAERPGVNTVLSRAGTEMLTSWELLKGTDEGVLRFFQDGFDRTADPCLEGRTQKLLELQVDDDGVFTYQLPASASPDQVIGEHLRIFRNKLLETEGSKKQFANPFLDAKKVVDKAHARGRLSRDEQELVDKFNAKFASWEFGKYVENLKAKEVPNLAGIAKERILAEVSTLRRLDMFAQ